jgi:hypothetical protein
MPLNQEAKSNEIMVYVEVFIATHGIWSTFLEPGIPVAGS